MGGEGIVILGVNKILFVGLILVACGPRVEDEEEQPEVERLCSGSCELLMSDCNPSEKNFSGVDECTSECISHREWTRECKWKAAELYECRNNLTCEEFARHVEGPLLEAPCYEQTWELSECNAG